MASSLYNPSLLLSQKLESISPQKKLDLSSVSQIIQLENNDVRLLDQGKLMFSLSALRRCILCLIENSYTSFDSHTTTNCCHGLTIYTNDLIFNSLNQDLYSLLNVTEQLISFANKNYLEAIDLSKISFYPFPSSLIELTQLFVLAFAKEKNEHSGGWQTSTSKVSSIAPLGNKFSKKLVKSLQRKFSNLIAQNYSSHLFANEKLLVGGLPVSIWKKYVQPKYLRTDNRGRVYAPCLFSMQVSLAYLIEKKAKIGIVNDIFDSYGSLTSRFIKILQGNGHSNFEIVEFSELDDLPLDDPLVIFGSCSHINTNNAVRIGEGMSFWANRFSNLVLACDTHYPQFPRVCDDPCFDDSPILVDEDIVEATIAEHRRIPGTSLSDPSFFCLSHVYPASLREVILEIENGLRVLPQSFLPSKHVNFNVSAGV